MSHDGQSAAVCGEGMISFVARLRGENELLSPRGANDWQNLSSFHTSSWDPRAIPEAHSLRAMPQPRDLPVPEIAA